MSYMNYIKDFFTKNIGYKLLSLIVAFVAWLLIVNINDPELSRTFTSNVEVINEDVLTAQGKYYTIANNSNTVSFRVKARRSVIEKLTSADFYATANMQLLEDDRRIPIEIEAINHTNAVSLSTKQHYLEVNVGKESTTKIVVEPKMTGTLVDGCTVDRVEIVPEIITVTGPDEIVAQIANVVANYNVSGQNTNYTEKIVPTFLNKKGEPIDPTPLRLEEDTITAHVYMTSIKTVPIVVQTGGRLDGDIELSDIKVEPQEIEIKGNRDVLNPITEITIPSSVIDLNNVTDTMSTTVDITTYLPNGVSLVDAKQTQVKISVEIHMESSREYSLSTSHISVRNLNSDLRASFTDDTVKISVSALPSVLDGIDEANLTGEVDISGLGVGTHTVKLTVDTDDKFTVAPATVKITITKRKIND